VLRNNQILLITTVPTPIIEDCHGLTSQQSVLYSSLISSPYRLIINSMVYVNTTPSNEIEIPATKPINLSNEYAIHLSPHYLEKPSRLLMDSTPIYPIQPEHLQRWHTAYSVIGIISTIVIITLLVILWKRQFIVKRTIQSATELQALHSRDVNP